MGPQKRLYRVYISSVERKYKVYLIKNHLKMKSFKTFNIIFSILLCSTPMFLKACYIKVGLTQEQKNAILNKHNELRNWVASGKQGQPAGGDMNELVWDDSLATVAEDYAKSCPMNGHNQNRGDNVGENIWTYMNSMNVQVDVTAGVQSWFDEQKDFECWWNPPNLYSFKPNPKTGHYTQVVWAKSTQLGNNNLFNNSFL